MITETLSVWFIHKQASGETSVQVSFFTRDKGMVKCLYRGGRTPKKQSLLQPFLPLWLSMDVRRNWHYVRQLESSALPLSLKGTSLFAALYLNELLYYALCPLEAHPQLHDLYQYTLQALTVLSERSAIEVVLRRFEMRLLLDCGYALCLTEEAVTKQAIAADKQYLFTPGHGLTAADKGLKGADIVAMAQDKLEDIAVLKTAKWIMRRAVDHLMAGREIKARLLFNTGIATQDKS